MMVLAVPHCALPWYKFWHEGSYSEHPVCKQVSGAAAAEPRIAGPISYIQPKLQGRQLQAKAQAAAHDTVATTQSAAQGSWWVPDASEQQAIASQGTVSQAAVKKQKGAKTEGEKVGHSC